VRHEPNSDLAGGEPLTSAQVAFADAAAAASRNGAAIQALVSDMLQAIETAITLDGGATQALLNDLTTDEGQTQFATNARAELEKVMPGQTLQTPARLTPLPPTQRYTEALNAFTAPDRFGTDMCKSDLPGLVAWLCQLGGY
jgi:hypothetical protein